jgi:8-oxo-dGTP pyrophosphatase MutT (NUDIX family)
MIYEKSCGAVVFRDEALNETEKQRYVLMIKHTMQSRYSFPKGHVESGESEIMTAEREVLEETSVSIKITEKFRQPVYYRPRPGAKKEVVYFVATTSQERVSPREGEVAWVEWVPVEKAITLLAHANDKKVLSSAIEYMENAEMRR